MTPTSLCAILMSIPLAFGSWQTETAVAPSILPLQAGAGLLASVAPQIEAPHPIAPPQWGAPPINFALAQNMLPVKPIAAPSNSDANAPQPVGGLSLAAASHHAIETTYARSDTEGLAATYLGLIK
jgi:hypothetical protein